MANDWWRNDFETVLRCQLKLAECDARGSDWMGNVNVRRENTILMDFAVRRLENGGTIRPRASLLMKK